MPEKIWQSSLPFDEGRDRKQNDNELHQIRENLTVKQAMSSLVEQAAKNDNISTLFMVTEDNTFYGAMDLKDLIIAKKRVSIRRSDRDIVPICIWK